MVEEILRHFPRQGALLYAVSDPDGLLAGEEVLAALYARGYTVIAEDDPVRLRREVLQHGPPGDGRGLIVAGEGPVEALPYDLWQPATRVSLSLPRLFPNLAYPVLQALTPGQRARLARVDPPPRRLGQQGSIDFVLSHVFEADVVRWREPAAFIEWLDARHSSGEDPVPSLFVARLARQLAELPAYEEWPLAALLADPERFRRFLDEQWRAYVARETGETLREAAGSYVLPFAEDEQLQDALPRLLRSGSLRRVDVARVERLPAWARPAVTAPDEDVAERRLAELEELLASQIEALPEGRWTAWKATARAWAEYGNLVFGRDPAGHEHPGHLEAYRRWQAQLDELFLPWLQEAYAPLGARQLPAPNHLFHVLGFLQAQRRSLANRPLALIVLDGMALGDWLLVRERWQQRHGGWRFEEQLLLAQAPSITSISRQALVSGERPAAFAERLANNTREGQHWRSFWKRGSLPDGAARYLRLSLRDGAGDLPPELGSARLQAACLVNNSIDDISHGASLGAADFLSSLEHWLAQRSPRLEAVIASLLARGFLVYVTSDHGHTEARGRGQPREGQIAETRGLRARVYRDRALAEEVQSAFPDTILWHGDGLLPDDAYALIPRGRTAFAREGQTVVTHGGLTLDEMVVPLVRIFE